MGLETRFLSQLPGPSMRRQATVMRQLSEYQNIQVTKTGQRHPSIACGMCICIGGSPVGHWVSLTGIGADTTIEREDT